MSTGGSESWLDFKRFLVQLQSGDTHVKKINWADVVTSAFVKQSAAQVVSQESISP